MIISSSTYSIVDKVTFGLLLGGFIIGVVAGGTVSNRYTPIFAYIAYTAAGSFVLGGIGQFLIYQEVIRPENAEDKKKTLLAKVQNLQKTWIGNNDL